jgi:hypothetical protein
MSWPLLAKIGGALIVLYLLLLLATVPGNPVSGSGSGNRMEQEK